MFLEIRINNVALDLYEKTKAKFNYYNPAFRASGGRSLPFTIPKSDHNLRLTGFVDRLDVSSPQKVENASVWLDGLPWDFGVIKMRAASDRSIEVYFEQTYTDLLKELETVLIKSLMAVVDIGTPSWFMTFDVTGQIAKTEDQEFTIVVNGQNCTYIALLGSGDDENDVVNGLRDLINADFPNLASVNAGDLTLSSSTYYAVSNDTPFGLTMIASQTYEDNVRQLWNTYLTNTNSDGLVFPSIINWKLYQDNNTWDGIINSFMGGAYEMTNAPQARPTDFSYTISPFVLLSKVFELLETNYNFSLGGTFINDTDIQNLFFLHNQTIDEAVYNYTAYVNLFKTNFDTGVFVPDMNGKELFEGFQMLFCLAYYWSEEYQTLTPKPRTDLLSTAVEDWTKKAAKGYKTDLPPRKGYRIEYQNDKDDTTSNLENQPIAVGDGETVYPLPIASAIQRNILTNEGMRSQIYMEQLNTGDFTPRLGIFKGMQPSNTGINYPKAEAIALNDIYINYWQEWADFLNNAKKLNKDFDLNINDLLKLKTFVEPMKALSSEAGSGVGMVSAFSFEASVKGMGLASVEIYTKEV